MGDVNIDTSAINKETSNYLSDLCDTFSLQNKTSTDIKLTNWSRNFYETEILGIGLRDNHKLIFSIFSAHIFQGHHQNLCDTKSIKHSMRPNFYISWIKNS